MIFNWGRARRALNLLSPAGWAPIADNPSGKCVNQQTALTLSAVWACTNLVAKTFATLPCQLFTKDQYGDKIPQTDHPLYTLLHDKPNSFQTAYIFWQVAISHMLLWGNFYALKLYRGRGVERRLIGIEILLPNLMSIRENLDGSLTYLYSDKTKRYEYDEEDIMHIRGFTVDGKVGLSAVSYGATSMGNSLAIEDSMGRLYSNGMRPAGALTLPNVLKAEQRKEIRDSVASQVAGVSRTGGMIILEAGMEYKSLSIPPVDMQALESKSFGIEDICRWFGVPPVLIGHSSKTTTWGTGLEQINLFFLTYTIQPLAENIEQQIKFSLLSPAERIKYFAEFNIEGLLRSDSASRAKLYSSYTQNGIMSRAEVRQKENLPWKEGSDELTVQSAQINLNDLDKLVAQNNPAPEEAVAATEENE